MLASLPRCAESEPITLGLIHDGLTCEAAA